MTNYKSIAESNNFIVLDKYTRQDQIAEGYQSEGDLERELIQDLSPRLWVFTCANDARRHAGECAQAATNP